MNQLSSLLLNPIKCIVHVLIICSICFSTTIKSQEHHLDLSGGVGFPFVFQQITAAPVLGLRYSRIKDDRPFYPSIDFAVSNAKDELWEKTWSGTEIRKFKHFYPSLAFCFNRSVSINKWSLDIGAGLGPTVVIEQFEDSDPQLIGVFGNCLVRAVVVRSFSKNISIYLEQNGIGHIGFAFGTMGNYSPINISINTSLGLRFSFPSKQNASSVE